MDKRLTKGSSPMIGGVMSGLAEYFGTDPLLLRIIGLVALLLNLGVGLIYLVCMVVFPPYDGPYQAPDAGQNRKTGYLLVAAGLLLLMRNFFPQLSLRFLLSLLFIGAGIYIIIRKK